MITPALLAWTLTAPGSVQAAQVSAPEDLAEAAAMSPAPWKDVDQLDLPQGPALQEEVPLPSEQPPPQAPSEGDGKSTAIAKRIAAVPLTLGTLCCTTLSISVAGLLCAISALSCIYGVVSFIQTFQVIPAAVLLGVAVISFVMALAFAVVSAGFTGLGVVLRQMGLWSWEVQLVFNVFMTVARIATIFI